VSHMFPGILCFFLMDLGLVAARRFSDLRSGGWLPVLFGLAFPLVSGSVAPFVAHLLGMSMGDALLFAMLCSSGSYIAVPAALRAALPEANPSIYVALALGVTFPFNLLIGIPMAYTFISRIWH